jgi:hypothetical protein
MLGAGRTDRPLVQARSPGCVTAAGRAGGGCGVTAVWAAARAGALSRERQRAKLSRQLRRDSPRPRPPMARLSRSFNASPVCCPRPLHESGGGRTARRAEGVPLKALRRESCHSYEGATEGATEGAAFSTSFTTFTTSIQPAFRPVPLDVRPTGRTMFAALRTHLTGWPGRWRMMSGEPVVTGWRWPQR